MTLPETSNSQDPAAAVPEEPTASTLPDENLEEHPGPTIRDEIIASLVNETLIRSIGAAQASIGLSNEQAAKMDNLYLRCDILNRVTGLASRKVIPLEFRDGLLQPKPDAGPILEVGQDSQFGFTVLIGEPVEEGCSGDKRLPTTVSAPGKQDPTPLAELEKVFDTLVISNPPTSEASPFTKLPVEILHQIIGLVKDNNSIISIATTCRKLQAIAEGITFRELPVCIGCRVPDCHRSPEQLILAIGGHGRRSHVRSLKVSLAIRENDNSGLPDKDALQNEIRERYTSACIKLFDTMSELQKMGVILRKVNVKQDTPHWWTMGLHITPGKALKIDKYSFPEVQDLKWTNKVAVVDPQSMVRHLKPFPNLIKLKFQVYGQLEYPDHSLRKSARLDLAARFTQLLPCLRELYVDTLSYTHPSTIPVTTLNMCPSRTPRLDTFSLSFASLSTQLRILNIQALPSISPTLFGTSENPLYWPNLHVFNLYTDLINSFAVPLTTKTPEAPPSKKVQQQLRLDLIEDINLAIAEALPNMPRLQRFRLNIGYQDDCTVCFVGKGLHDYDEERLGQNSPKKGLFIQESRLFYATSVAYSVGYVPSKTVVKAWKDRFGKDLCVEAARGMSCQTL